MWDPWYGWTWVDDAPWGWAPFHHGRWLYVSGYWAWCPGPLVVRPYYAPALVAFYGSGDFGLRFRPYVGWVALGWGEPLIPWWGPSRFRRRAHWAGWGGPRLVNQVAVETGRVYRADEIHAYQNAGVRSAVLEVERDRFGRRGGEDVSFRRAKPERLSPVQSRMDVGPDRSSLVGELRPAKRPPEPVRSRSVVATRPPRLDPAPRLPSVPSLKPRGGAAGGRSVPEVGPPARVMSPQTGRPGEVIRRAPFGTRGTIERVTPPPAPRYEGPSVRRPATSPQSVLPSRRREIETRAVPPGAVPGEPANRVYRGSPAGRGGVAPRGHAPGR
jgi:hypothetical protein